MILIIGTKALSREEIEKARLFLKKIKPILATNECIFRQSEKNREFDRCCPIMHEEKVNIIKSLEEHDCIKIEPNNNPRYTDSEVYVFSKDCKLFIYGEEEILTLYIKMYVQESSNYDVVIGISFHQEGMHG